MMTTMAVAPAAPPAVSHNLLGQRIGRKGRETRERILAATARLLEGPSDSVISLSAVAREASLAMTTLYLYFGDLSELLMAALEPIMAAAEASYVTHLRKPWPEAELGAHCVTFVRAYHALWQRHTRILHLRNSLADAGDSRLRQYRIDVSVPVIQLLIAQMGGDPSRRSAASSMATVLVTSIERLITITTDTNFSSLPLQDHMEHVDDLLRAEARLLEIAIRDGRSIFAQAA